MSRYCCPVCAGNSQVIETRASSSRLRRRRMCSQGHRFTTLELPYDTPKKLNDLIAFVVRQLPEEFRFETADYAKAQLGHIITGSAEDTGD